MERRPVNIGGATLDTMLGGSGPVTVVFENGLGMSLDEWETIAGRVATRARTLCYDRRRAPATGALRPRTATDMAADLEKLLDSVAVPPPYVLVGHSWGGVIARVFAHAHPSAVAGLVLVDATHEVVDSRAFALLPLMHSVMSMAARTSAGRRWLLRQICPEGAPAAYRTRVEQTLNDRARWNVSLRTARSEGAGIRPSLEHVRRECPDLPPIPIHVLTAGGVEGPNVKTTRRVHEAWRAAVSRASAAQYTNVPTGGHQLPVDSPDVVIGAIFGVLDAVEQSAHRG